MNAIIVFSSAPVKHCTHVFALIECANSFWVRLDSSYGKIDVDTCGPPDVDDIRAQGFPCFEIPIGTARCYAPVQPFSCVSIVKRAAGISAPLIFTSKQLYRYLMRTSYT